MIDFCVGFPGSGSNELDNPRPIAPVHMTGCLYVSDVFNHRNTRFVRISLNDAVIAAGSTSETSNNRLYHSYGFVLDETKHSFYIADYPVNTIPRSVFAETNWVSVARRFA